MQAFLNRKTINTKMLGKKYSTKYAEKRMLVYSVRSEIRRQSITQFDHPWEYFHRIAQIFEALHMSENDHKSSMSFELGDYK